MRLFSVSIGLLLAALGVFFVPVSFAVDGFGLVVDPGGVRTVRAAENGVVLHFAAEPDGTFGPGQIVTAVITSDAVAQNALLERTLRRDFSKAETDHLDKTAKILTELDRDRAKREATRERVAATRALEDETETVLAELRNFTADSSASIDQLNAERLSQLAQLEDLVKRSGDVAALPAQRLATMLDDIQADRLSVISSEGTKFSTDRMVLDLIKTRNELRYTNSIDGAEVGILSERIARHEAQLRELEALRLKQRAEAEARFLAKAELPQVAVATGQTVDMRTLQADRADVARNDPLRLLALREPAAGISMLVYGDLAQGRLRLRVGGEAVTLPLTGGDTELSDELRRLGLPVAKVRSDRETAGAISVHSIFVEFASAPPEGFRVLSAGGHDADGVPVLVTTSLLTRADAEAGETPTDEIIGFLENRHAVVLRPGQVVRGSISDARTGSEIVFSGRLKSREVATVDTKELGIRLGNASLATKIIKRGVLSQVVIEVDDTAAGEIASLPGAVVQLTFPLARQTLFSFLLAGDATI